MVEDRAGNPSLKPLAHVYIGSRFARFFVLGNPYGMVRVQGHHVVHIGAKTDYLALALAFRQELNRDKG